MTMLGFEATFHLWPDFCFLFNRLKFKQNCKHKITLVGKQLSMALMHFVSFDEPFIAVDKDYYSHRTSNNEGSKDKKNSRNVNGHTFFFVHWMRHFRDRNA